MTLSQRASLSPEIPKSCWRQLSVSDRVLDIPVAEVSLQGSGVVALIGEREAAGVPQHVRVGLEAKTRLSASALDHSSEASGAEGRSSLRSEHEGRLRLLLALKAPQGSQFIAEDRVGARRAPLDPAHVQRSRSKIDLIPSEVNKLRGAEAVTVGHEDHCRVPMPPTVLPSGVHEPFDLCFRQVLTGSQVGVRRPPGRDCSIYDGWCDQLQVWFLHVFGPRSPNDCSDNDHSLDSP
jgi:hypothetical protein